MNYRRSFTGSFGAGGMFPPAIKWLLIINVAAFLGPRVFYLDLRSIVNIFGLVPGSVFGKFYIWQLVTYMFLHGGTWHLFFNMFAVWMFGAELERYWGTKEFLKFYFITGIGAGLTNLLFSIFNPATVIGASGAVYGILVAYAMLFPDRYVYLYFLLPVKVKYLVAVLVFIEFMSTYRADQIAHFAHLGGALFGFLYLKQNWRWKLRKWSPEELIRRLRESRETKKGQAEKQMMEEVDEILDKINKVGYENLTKQEKKILDKASNKLSDGGDK